MQPLLIYIHGFQSSPRSQKAQEVQQFLRDHGVPVEFAAPQLANYPALAYQQLVDLVRREQGRQLALIGSSLGGFYATVLAEQFGLRAVLVNPAVNPSRLIEQYLGPNQNPYTGEQFVLTRQHYNEMKQLEPDCLQHPEHLWLMVQTGDETLDYREAVRFYQRCPQQVEEGGNHRFVDFSRHLPEVLKFLQLPLV